MVENKAGASGVVGSEFVARARADGYTLLVTTGSHTSNPVTLKSLPYDTERDFVPITILADTPFALVGSTSAGFDTAEKFLAAARAKPGQFAFGSSENTSRLVGELFRQRADLQLRAVPYKGAAPMLQDLAGGHIPVGFTTPLSAISLHRAGSAKILAITSDRRLTVLPEVPTMQEVGVSGVTYRIWFSLFGPAGLPPALASKIREDVVAVLAEPEVVARIRELAGEPGGEAPDALAGRIRRELATWRETARVAGIEPE